MIALLTQALAADLAVEITGLPSDDGFVSCALYADADQWLDDGGVLRSAVAQPAGGRARCVFPDVPQGLYAVAFLQDLNENGTMDYFAGLPREPWGISRNPAIRLGRPRWQDAVFAHPGALAPLVAK
jgi:uncharacterized protein (DUF2141 family)